MSTPRSTSERRDPVRETMESFEDSGTELANEVNNIVQAWSQANAALVTGSLRVFGDLFVGVNDTLTRTAREGRERVEGEREGTAAEPVRGASNAVSDLARTVARAVSDEARVVQESGERFSDVYESQAEEAERPAGSQSRARRGRYESMTVEELQEEAAQAGVEGRSSMNKQQLVAALRNR